jgi:hypothetical protein
MSRAEMRQRLSQIEAEAAALRAAINRDMDETLLALAAMENLTHAPAKIVAVLYLHGPTSRRELLEYIGSTGAKSVIGVQLSRARKKLGEDVFVVTYSKTVELTAAGRMRVASAIYDLRAQSLTEKGEKTQACQQNDAGNIKSTPFR